MDSSRPNIVTRIRVSRAWLARRGAASRRGVRLSFWLSRPAAVVVRVDRLAPDCRYVGKFIVRGHVGRNVVRFRGRLRGRALAPGTYRLIAHPRGEPDRRLERTTVVVFERPPRSAAEVRAARARNECPTGTSPSERQLLAIAASEEDGGKTAQGIAGALAGIARGGLLDLYGPIARSLGKATTTLEDAARTIPPALFAVAIVAVLLLAVASMPPLASSTRAGAILVHGRASIALAGSAALAAAIVTYLLLMVL